MVETAREKIQLSDSERDAFLDRVSTGVLSLSTPSDEPPHSVPVSFGYNAVQTAFYFRIADLPPKRKGELDGRSVTFVTYDRDEEIGGYVSVVAQGTLEPTTGDETATESARGIRRRHDPVRGYLRRSTSRCQLFVLPTRPGDAHRAQRGGRGAVIDDRKRRTDAVYSRTSSSISWPSWSFVNA